MGIGQKNQKFNFFQKKKMVVLKKKKGKKMGTLKKMSHDVKTLVSASIIFKLTPCTCVLKTNFYTHKKKSHVPALIFKFLTTTPNLTSNFET